VPLAVCTQTSTTFPPRRDTSAAFRAVRSAWEAVAHTADGWPDFYGLRSSEGAAQSAQNGLGLNRDDVSSQARPGLGVLSSKWGNYPYGRSGGSRC
jgi:hypothetical protein